MLMLRDGVANDWASICRECHLDPKEYHTAHLMVRERLDQLKEAGFIEFNTVPESYPDTIITGPIRITKGWEKAQRALGISLAQLAELIPDDTMVVRPCFGLPPKPVTELDVFVLMPFKPELKPVYEDHIRPISQRLELAIARADDFFTAHSVMSDVWAAVCAARVLIADCTGRNPNVFYEIGLAHVLGKDVILITQNNEDVPFDLGHLRRIEYQYTPRGMSEFEKRLSETLRTVLAIE
jgi:hypothetical protein